MKLFKTIVTTLLILLVAGIALGQNGRNNAVICKNMFGATSYISPVRATTRTDSIAFVDSHYFLIPEGVRTDTLQLLIWTTSVKGAVHLKIAKFDGMMVGSGTGATFKGSADSVAVSGDWSTESLKSVFIAQVAKDTTFQNLATGTSYLPPTAMKITIRGYTGNRNDFRYAIQLVARKFNNTL
jgi:hypothetical protein